MFIAAGGPGLKQSGLATLVRQGLGSVVHGSGVGPVGRWFGEGVSGGEWMELGSAMQGVVLGR